MNGVVALQVCIRQPYVEEAVSLLPRWKFIMARRLVLAGQMLRIDIARLRQRLRKHIEYEAERLIGIKCELSRSDFLAALRQDFFIKLTCASVTPASA